MRSRTISRHYIQCMPNENLNEWSDDRIWTELRLRLGDPSGDLLKAGPVLDKSVTPMRSFVAEPLRQGRLLDAVPKTGGSS